MKNVNGLASAMRTVESACEKGEITIIGEGATPTAVELYKKCVAFINREYGVDILNLVLKGEKPCECNGSCTTIIVDTEADEEHYLDVNAELAVKLVREVIGEEMGYLSTSTIGNLIIAFKDYYYGLDELLADEYDEDYIEEVFYDILSDHIEMSDYDEDYISDIIGQIIHRVKQHNCIRVV